MTSAGMGYALTGHTCDTSTCMAYLADRISTTALSLNRSPGTPAENSKATAVLCLMVSDACARVARQHLQLLQPLVYRNNHKYTVGRRHTLACSICRIYVVYIYDCAPRAQSGAYHADGYPFCIRDTTHCIWCNVT